MMIRTGRPTLGVSMIVRDERYGLARSLESVVNVADRLVVADTGSGDDTPAIARLYGAKVLEVTWESDFSKARGKCLEAVDTDWVLVLDADEELPPDAADLLPRLLAETPADVLYLPRLTESRKGHLVRYEHVPRLFRNHRGFRYENDLPEQLHYDGKEGFAPLPLHHFGFSASPEALTGRLKRFRSLLATRMDGDPNNPLFPQMLALSSLWEGKTTPALEMAQRAWTLAQQAPHEPRRHFAAVFVMVTVLLRSGHVDAAERVLAACAERDPHHIDILALRVQERLARRKHDDALLLARTYLDAFHGSLGAHGKLLSEPLHSYGSVSDIALLLAKEQFDHREDDAAQALLRLALEHGGGNPRRVANVVDLLMKERGLDTVLSLCREHHRLAQLWNQTFVYLYKRRDLAGLRQLLGERHEAARLYGPDFDRQPCGPFLLSTAALAEQLDERDQAMNLYHASLTLPDPPRKAVQHLALSYYRQERHDEAARVLQEHLDPRQPDYDMLGFLTLLHFLRNKERDLSNVVRLASSRMALPIALPLSTPEQLAERVHELATRLWQQDWPSAAAWYYLLETKLRPQFMPAWKGLAETLHAVSDLQGAVAALEHALVMQPSRGDLWMLLSHWHEEEGREESAVLCRKKAEEITIFLVRNQLMQADTAESCASSASR